MSLQEGVDTFLEEAVVRRELSDNFCFYEPSVPFLSALSLQRFAQLYKLAGISQADACGWDEPLSPPCMPSMPLLTL